MPDSHSANRATHQPTPGLGVSAVDSAVRGFFAQSLAPATRTVYRSATNRYFTFCRQFNFSPLPLTQESVSRFVASLAQSGVSYQTIRIYLSGIRFTQIASGLPDPHLELFPQLNYVLRGIHRTPRASPRHPRRPITPSMMYTLFSEWSAAPRERQYDAAALWAACCIAFFGFLRAGEFTCPSWRAYSSDRLSPRDVSVDSREAPTVLSIYLRHSKTDPFGNGVTIYLGRTGHEICPVAALLGYLVLRGQQPGPLFLLSDGTPLSKDRLIADVRLTLSRRGVDTSGIKGHSFRIGAATAAAQAGLQDSLIQMLGRWHSSAFLRYIQAPARTLGSATAQLIPPQSPVPP